MAERAGERHKEPARAVVRGSCADAALDTLSPEAQPPVSVQTIRRACFSTPQKESALWLRVSSIGPNALSLRTIT